MRLEVAADAELAARLAARLAAGALREALAARGHAAFAVSGGTTPARMLRHLAAERLDWREVDLFQVDERCVAADAPERNFRALVEVFRRTGKPPGPRERIESHDAASLHAMPVEMSDLDAAARAYADTLSRALGPDGVLDVVHLGLGSDGHTASLVPGDPVLESVEKVAVSGEYAGVRRMTLTFGMLDSARLRLWLVTGEGKRAALARLLAGDPRLVAARVRREASVVVADAAAAGGQS